MDRIIEQPKRKPLRIAMLAGGGLAATVLLYLGLVPVSGKTFEIAVDRLTISRVAVGDFEDFIPVRATVEPFRTTYLDTVEGGRVERLHVEDGALVKPGQLLVELSNTTLQLNVMSLEANVTEQLNRVHDLELTLEQTRLENRKNLAEIEYRLKVVTREVADKRRLVDGGHIPSSELEDAEDSFVYHKTVEEITRETLVTKERIQESQLAQLQASAKMLRTSMDFARDNLERLRVRAPIAGKLTGLDLEIGQSVVGGERLGQIDDPTRFKVEAQIDEFYLDRVYNDQTARYRYGDKEYPMHINKVYPQVSDGQFQADLIFDDEVPSIRRGQTLQLQITLGTPERVLLIPYGAFYQDTGGNWIFVVSEDGHFAVDARNLKSAPDPLMKNLMRLQANQVLAFVVDCTAISLNHPGQKIERGRLARTVWTDKGGDFPPGELKAAPIDSVNAPKVLPELLDLEGNVVRILCHRVVTTSLMHHPLTHPASVDGESHQTPWHEPGDQNNEEPIGNKVGRGKMDPGEFLDSIENDRANDRPDNRPLAAEHGKQFHGDGNLQKKF